MPSVWSASIHIAVLGLMLLAAPVVNAETLEQEMSSREFERAGLEKLTPEELAFLNAFLGRKAETTEESFGKEQVEQRQIVRQKREPAEFETHIVGEFRGWDGATVFRLANGQIWQQRIKSKYRFRATDPAVTLVRGRFGYYLKLQDSGRQVAVKRLK